MLLVTLRVAVAGESRPGVLQPLRSVLGPTRVKRGCLSCRLYEDLEEEGAVSLVEEWETREDLERHLRSDDYRKILAVMESAARPPDLKVHSIARTAGFEAVEMARAEL